jgi:hypothetical protein
MANILMVYCCDVYPVRETIRDHLYAFRRYTPHRWFYLNVAASTVPRSLSRVSFDAVVFHTTFLSQRWSPALFARRVAGVRPLKEVHAIKVALPQDEFIHTDILCDFINEFGIDHVFSVAPPTEWPEIYSTVDFRKTKLSQILTGYLDEKTVARIASLARSAPPRTIDIGYRAWRAAAWLGRHGYLKTEIADRFQELARTHGLAADISTRDRDTLLGDDWFRFLLRSKYTIGVEGGASILDRDGSIRLRTDQYVKEHPDASFSEIEAACFPGVDGSFKLFAISPRHLEACATRTCQILVEGTYNGILTPGTHYIELKKDLSNMEQVLDSVGRDDLRAELTENAHRDVVLNEHYSSRAFANEVVEKALRSSHGEHAASLGVCSRIVWLWMRLEETRAWATVALRQHLFRPLRHAAGQILRPAARVLLPSCVKKRLRRILLGRRR